MANKARSYTIVFAYKEDGNRNLGNAETAVIEATTVQRAITKLVRELNAEPVPEDEEVNTVKTSDLLVIDVRTADVTKLRNHE